MQKEQKLIPITEYVHLNRKGFPCSESWKWRLVKLDKKGIKKAPFNYIIKKEMTYIVLD